MTKADYFVLSYQHYLGLSQSGVGYLYLYQPLALVESLRCSSRGAENRILYPQDDILPYLHVNRMLTLLLASISVTVCYCLQIE